MTKLKEILIDRGISQNQLARGAEMPQSAVNLIVNSKLHPWPGYKKRISAFLGLQVEEVFPEEETQE